MKLRDSDMLECSRAAAGWWWIAFLVVSVGWLMSIVKLTNCDLEAPYKAEFIHTVGLVPVVGAITGWMDVGQ